MFDIVRTAAVAVFALGAAGATGQIRDAQPETAPPPVIATVPLGDTTIELPAVEPETKAEAVEAAPVPATSLAALVRRHADSEPSDREMDCLAGATYFESKGEPLEGQLAVANVILNRAESGRFARTICGVVLQRGQFSFVRGGAIPRIDRSTQRWRTAVAIAHIARNDLWEPKVETALFFHARHVAPGWRLARVGTVGNHVFYR
jgi:N-acetylmuramoyl-L-alanine amidase